MITIFIVLIVLGILFMAICMGAVILIDPLIAILVIIGIVKLVKTILTKKNEKG